MVPEEQHIFNGTYNINITKIRTKVIFGLLIKHCCNNYTYLLFQVHCYDYFWWNYGPRRGQEKTPGWQDPWIFLLNLRTCFAEHSDVQIDYIRNKPNFHWNQIHTTGAYLTTTPFLHA